MSTRAIIAYKTGKNETDIVGTYHHSDGYPSGLGAELYRLYSTVYKNRLADLVKILITDYPNGWSYITDWTGSKDDIITFDQKEAMYKQCREIYQDFSQAFDEAWKQTKGKAVYYTGERAGKLFTYNMIVNSWAEYVYVFDEEQNVMLVYDLDNRLLKLLGTFKLDDPEPNWDNF